MEAYRVEKRVATNGILQLNAFPFREGEWVEVIVLRRKGEERKSAPSPVRGKVVAYFDPTEPVAENDWDSLR